MKTIKVNLEDNNTIEHIKDVLWIIIAILLLFVTVGQVNIEEEHREIKTRYEQIKQENTDLIKINKEQSEYIKTLLKEANEQPSIVNNKDTREE